ncbi:MAG: GatB/YqeY domain-containing protein [Thermomicrobiales bacterium]
MPANAASIMKDRLRADLRAAMQERNASEARVLRSLIAAIDNAEAPAISTAPSAHAHDFASGAAEVERLVLDDAQIARVLQAEIAERDCAAATFTQLGQPERAAELEAEAAIARRYVGGTAG